MLIITRKEGESIQITDSISVTVTKISPSKVKLKVIAPREISIYRTELIEPTVKETKVVK